MSKQVKFQTLPAPKRALPHEDRVSKRSKPEPTPSADSASSETQTHTRKHDSLTTDEKKALAFAKKTRLMEDINRCIVMFELKEGMVVDFDIDYVPTINPFNHDKANLKETLYYFNKMVMKCNGKKLELLDSVAKYGKYRVCCAMKVILYRSEYMSKNSWRF